ncbi:MAG: hypothetical protein IAG13_10570, partial [Deltaproteobacteria bacterium]|nr:hypothetical protein [Nannocystaceae bacterium]
MSSRSQLIVAEAAWLREWMADVLGIVGTPPAWRSPPPAAVRSFWDTVGFAAELGEVIVDPVIGSAPMDERLAQWRDDGEPGAAVSLPARWRLVQIDGNGFLVTDERDDVDDPAVVGVTDHDPTLQPEWRSYVQRATAGIIAMIVHRLRTVTALLRDPPGHVRLPTLAPAL